MRPDGVVAAKADGKGLSMANGNPLVEVIVPTLAVLPPGGNGGKGGEIVMGGRNGKLTLVLTTAVTGGNSPGSGSSRSMAKLALNRWTNPLPSASGSKSKRTSGIRSCTR